jgi:norsolorinic acid ketoreductase
MSGKSYLITGANRGLGKGLVTSLLSRPNTTVIAGVRDPTAAVSQELTKLPTANGSKLIIVKLDSTSFTDAEEARTILETKYGLTKLDVLVANAGILTRFGPALETPAKDLIDVFSVNAVAPLVQLQGLWPLMQKSEKPGFYVVSTNIASLGLMEHIPLPAISYGVSKVAANYIVRKLHFENPELISVALHPGWVQTDMGWFAANSNGVKEVPVTIDQSVSGLLAQIDGATKEETSGSFVGFDGKVVPW